MNRITVIVTACLAPALASAQPQAPSFPTEFPEAAAALAPADLQSRLAGKVFRVNAANGQSWRLDFKSNGYVFLDVSNGFRDTGRWRVEGSSMCDEWQKGVAAPGCNELRAKDGALYLKRRSNGEVVRMIE